MFLCCDSTCRFTKLRNVVIVTVSALVLIVFSSKYFFTELPRKGATSTNGGLETLPAWSVKECREDIQVQRWHSQGMEDKALMKGFYKNKGCGGVFTEMGALDGVLISNTLTLENSFAWTGNLIEANPTNFESLIVNRQKTKNYWSAACAENMQMLYMVGAREMAKIGNKVAGSIAVPCRPLGDILKSSGFSAIDIFFLDVEGSEYVVLQTMDWSIPVGLWVIEVAYPYHQNKAMVGENHPDRKVQSLLISKGYVKSSFSIEDFYFEKRKRKPAVHDVVYEHPLYRKYLSSQGL